MAKGYLITVYHAIYDVDKLAAYADLARPALESFGGRFLVRGMPAAVKENGMMERAVVCEFPSVAEALAALESAEYAEALSALDGGAVRDMRIVEGA